MNTHTLVALMLAVASCRPAPTTTTSGSAPPDPSSIPPAPGLERVDTTQDPCVDFYQYACGAWLADNPRPSETPVWARSFSVAEQRTEGRLTEILEASADSTDPALRPIGDHWRACRDAEQRNTAGLAALAPMLTAIDRLRPDDLWAVVGLLHTYGVRALVGIRHQQGPHARTMALGIGGTGLGPPAMYDPKQSAPRLAGYRRHVAELLRLSGSSEPARRTEAVIDFETRLADLQATMAELVAEESHPPTPQSLKAVKKATPSIDWDRYFAALGQPLPEQLIVPPNNRLEQLAALLRRTDVAVLKDYLRWQTLHWTATIAPPAFADEHASMYDPGSAGLVPGCTSVVRSAYGPALGRVYADTQVSPDDRGRLRALAERLRTSLHDEVERTTWLDPATRKLLLGRIDTMTIELASELGRSAPPASVPEGFLAAALALRRQRIAAELAGTADVAAFTGAAINAAMLGEKLELSAGLVQAPFYTADMPEPVLLGAIGQIVAHEFGHILDPQTLAEEIAWTPEPATATAYATRLQCIHDSYAKAEVGPGLHVDGGTVTKEVFADNLGLRIAHAQLRRGPAGPAGERQFFVAWAQLMCTHIEPDALPMLVQMDVPPAPLRVNQPLRLFPGFAAAFACAEGTPMRPRDACTPW